MRIAVWFLGVALVSRACCATDGDLDGTFGNYLPGVSKVAFDLGTGNGDSANELLVQKDGKLVLVGNADSSAGSSSRIAIARLTPSGALDSSFGGTGRISYAPTGMLAHASKAALQVDGKIVTIGSATLSTASNDDFLICRFGANGTPDTGFGSAGCKTIPFDLGLNTDEGSAIAIQSDGKIVVGGSAAGATSGQSFAFARLNTNGTLDASFGFGGTGKQLVTRFKTLAGVSTYDGIRAIVIQTDGKIIGAGYTEKLPGDDFNFAAARLDATGQLDASYGNGGVQIVTFDFGGSKGDSVFGAALQNDGKLVLAGYATFSPTDTDYAVARLDSNGQLDSSFNGVGKRTIAFDLGGSPLPDFANAVTLQSDGKIVLAGASYNPFNGGINDDDITACRLLTDGSLDSTFANSGRLTIGLNLGWLNFDRAAAVALQNGRIVMAGEVALNPAGNRDFIALRLTNDLIFTDGFGL